MSIDEYDVVVAGAGTAGCYAAATIANEGLDVVIVERKDAEEASPHRLRRRARWGRYLPGSDPERSAGAGVHEHRRRPRALRDSRRRTPSSRFRFRRTRRHRPLGVRATDHRRGGDAGVEFHYTP